jgi:hypothetical protein
MFFMSPPKNFRYGRKEEETMDRQVTILYIDQDYQISHWTLRGKDKTVSQIPLPQAIEMLKTKEFDLIFSEPQNMALLKSAPERPAVEGKGLGIS